MPSVAALQEYMKSQDFRPLMRENIAELTFELAKRFPIVRDDETWEEVAKTCFGYAVSTVIRCSSKYIDENDLWQECMRGMFYSASKYSPDVGVAFSSYAYKYMRGLCRNHVSEFISPLKLNRNKITKVLKLTREDQSTSAYVDKGLVVTAQLLLEGASSIENLSERHEVSAPPDHAENNRDFESIPSMLSVLDEMLKLGVISGVKMNFLRAYYVEGLSYEEIGQKFSLHPYTIQQHIVEAKGRIKSYFEYMEKVYAAEA